MPYLTNQPRHRKISLSWLRLLPYFLLPVISVVRLVAVVNGQVVVTDVPQPAPVSTLLPTSLPTSSRTQPPPQQEQDFILPTIPSVTSAVPVCADDESLIQVKFDLSYEDWLQLDLGDDYYNQNQFDFGNNGGGTFLPSVQIKYSWMSRKQQQQQDNVGNVDLTDDGQLQFATTGEYRMYYDTYDSLLYDQFELNLCVPNNECYFVSIQEMPTQFYQIYVNNEPVELPVREFDESASYIPYQEIHPHYSNEEDKESSSSVRPALSSSSTIIYPCYYNNKFNCTVTEVSSRVTTSEGGNGNACVPSCDNDLESLFEYRFYTGDQISDDERWDYRAYDYRLEELSFIDGSIEPTNAPIIFDNFNNDDNDPTASIVQTSTILNCESFNCAKTSAINTLESSDMVIERVCLPKVRKNEQQQPQQQNATTVSGGTCYRFLVGNSHVSKGIQNGGPDIYVAYDNQVLLHSDFVRMEVVEFGTGCDKILPFSSSSCLEYGLASSSSYSVVEFLMYRQQEDIQQHIYLTNHPAPLTWSISTRYYYEEDTTIPVQLYEQAQESYFVPDDEGSTTLLLSSEYTSSIQSISLYYDRICVPKDSCVVFELDRNDGSLNQFYDDEKLIPSWYELKYDDVYYRVSNTDFLTYPSSDSESETTLVGPTCGQETLFNGRHIICDHVGYYGGTIFEFNFETITTAINHPTTDVGCRDSWYSGIYATCNDISGVLNDDDIYFYLVERYRSVDVKSNEQFDFYKLNTKYAMIDCVYLSSTIGNEQCSRPEFILYSDNGIAEYELKRDGETIVQTRREYDLSPNGYLYIDYTTTPFEDCSEDVPIGSILAVVAILLIAGTGICYWTKKHVGSRHPGSTSPPPSGGANTTTAPGRSSSEPVATATLVSQSLDSEQPRGPMVEMTPITTSSTPVAEATVLPPIGQSNNVNGVGTNTSVNEGNRTASHQPPPPPQQQSINLPPATLSQDIESDDWA